MEVSRGEGPSVFFIEPRIITGVEFLDLPVSFGLDQNRSVLALQLSGIAVADCAKAATASSAA
jgi:hypothetical protein